MIQGVWSLRGELSQISKLRFCLLSPVQLSLLSMELKVTRFMAGHKLHSFELPCGGEQCKILINFSVTEKEGDLNRTKSTDFKNSDSGLLAPLAPNTLNYGQYYKGLGIPSVPIYSLSPLLPLHSHLLHLY